MSRAASKAFRISLLATMIALTAVLEIINRMLPLRVPWGMSIDFVALPVMLAFFILGTRYAILCGVGMYAILLIIGFAGFVGGTMKFFATIPMVLVFGALMLTPLKNKDSPALTYRSMPKFILVAALALAARCAVATFLNYYWAIPLFFSMPVDQVIQAFFFGSIWGFVGYISALNITQGVLDLALSWTIAFGFGLIKRFTVTNEKAGLKA
jgi:riboflavin transporter FmnP